MYLLAFTVGALIGAPTLVPAVALWRESGDRWAVTLGLGFMLLSGAVVLAFIAARIAWGP